MPVRYKQLEVQVTDFITMTDDISQVGLLEIPKIVISL